MNDSKKKNFIYIETRKNTKLYKKKQNKIMKQQKLKMGVLLRFWVLVHQLGYQVFLEFQSCFKFQLFLK